MSYYSNQDKKKLILFYIILTLIFVFNFLNFYYTPEFYFILPFNLFILVANMVVPISIFLVYTYLFTKVANKKNIILFTLGMLIIAFGKGAHFVANEFNPNVIYTGTDYNLKAIFFLDEYFSHFVMGIGLAIIAFLSLLQLEDFSLDKKLRIQEILALIILTMISVGHTAFLLSVESHQLVPYFFFSIIFMPILVRKLKKTQISQNPLAIIFITGLLISLVIILFWWLKFGGFPQPSEVGL